MNMQNKTKQNIKTATLPTKKILIISGYFAPCNAIASIRFTKISKYLKLLKNYEITVISKELFDSDIKDPILSENLKYVDNHILVQYSTLFRIAVSNLDKLSLIKRSNIKKQVKNNSVKTSTKTSNLELFLQNITRRIRYYAEKNYAGIAIKKIKNLSTSFDVVISTYGYFSGHIIGNYVKKQNKDVVWIADFRDPVINFCTPSYYLNYFNQYIKKVSKESDIITGVSNSCIYDLQLYAKEKCHIISNGFDKDDIKYISFKKQDKFTFVYTGTMCTGKSDLSAFFRAISELINENKIKNEHIKIIYAGADSKTFYNQILEYNLINIAKINGLIDREKSLEMQLNSDVLLLASWNNVGEEDIITGKFYEYLMINKPIICLVSGNLSNSKLKVMIEKANSGFVFEQANNESDYLNLKGYILKQYTRYLHQLPIEHNPNMEYIQQFDYENITQQFIDLFEKKEN